MRVAQKIAGYDLSEADNLRKACGKKDPGTHPAEREKFVAGCVSQGYGRTGDAFAAIVEHHRALRRLCLQQVPRLRLTASRLQTAWLKAHHPVEYLASLLTGQTTRTRTAVYLGEAGLSASRPWCPTSTAPVRVRRDYSGGEGTVGQKGDGPGPSPSGWPPPHVARGWWPTSWPSGRRTAAYADFYDFCQRSIPRSQQEDIESLIKAGGFDSLGHPRRGLCLAFEEIVDRTLERRRSTMPGWMSLFATLEPETDGQAVGSPTPGSPPDTEFARPSDGLREGDARALHQRPSPPRSRGSLAG